MAKETNFLDALRSGEIKIPSIKEGIKLKGNIIKKIENGVLVDCDNGAFTGVILSKEVKELERSKFELTPGREIEVEIINTNIRHEDGYYIVSVTKLLQYDVRKSLLSKFEKDDIITVIPTEANLGGLLIDMHGIKGFIPLSQLAPIHYPRVEDGDQEAIFNKLLDIIGKEINVRIINIDEEEKRIILSEREALKEDREKVLAELGVGKIFDGVVSGVSSYGLFVTIGGTVEGLVHISEITYGHVNDIDKLGKVGDEIKVEVIGLENGKISLSSKKLKGDPRSRLPKQYKIGDMIEGEVIRFVPYGVFMRVFEDINGLIHLSELSQKSVNNPNEVVKLGQVVKAKIILLDPKNRKIGLSMKGKDEQNTPRVAPKRDEVKVKQTEKPVDAPTEAPKEEKEAPKKSGKGLQDVVKKLAAEGKVAKKAKKTDEEKPAKPAKKAPAKKTTKKE
ncbi:S1 RNA-binding domain-containing protein [Candidatus Gracilibacteria bacterium]|nr:S1 RNA-binding domain-containing protein [Candidatus Gracilibacteria bacterium]